MSGMSSGIVVGEPTIIRYRDASDISTKFECGTIVAPSSRGSIHTQCTVGDSIGGFRGGQAGRAN